MKTSIITYVSDKPKEYKKDGQTFYYYNISLKNGDDGSIGTKNIGSYNVGDSLDYTIENGQYGNKIKKVKPQYSGNNKKSSNASFALSYAKDIVYASIDKGTNLSYEYLSDSTIIMANKFLARLNKNDK